MAPFRCFVFSAFASLISASLSLQGTSLSIAGAEESEAPDVVAPQFYPAVFDRLSLSYFVRPELPEGAVYSPQLSPEREAELFMQALIEDAQRRATTAIGWATSASLPRPASSIATISSCRF